MDITEIDGYTLTGLNKINIILGKNGVDKSRLLRHVEQRISSQSGIYGKSKYITPERGGELSLNSSIEQNMSNDDNWLPGDRRKNQSTIFRSQTVSQYAILEVLILRELEKDQNKDTFDPYIAKINSLLDNIEIVRSGRTFKIYSKSSNQELRPSEISSGESELISLMGYLLFFKNMAISKIIPLLV